MKKTNISGVQALLTLIFIVSYIISNIISVKQIALPFGLTATATMLIFPITYILSDVFSEVYGYRYSRITSYLAFGANAFVVLLFQLAIILPPSSFYDGQEAFASVLGAAPRVFIASMAAYLVGDFVNDKVFARMKDKYVREAGKDTLNGFGARAIVSSLCGELFDSTVFVLIAFTGTTPWHSMACIIAVEVTIKVCYEVAILPLTRIICKKVMVYEDT